MKVFINSYSTVYQRGGGGVPMRIRTISSGLKERGIDVQLFNTWEDKLKDADILHIFKATIDSYAEIMYAKECGVKVVLSSVVPQEGQGKIRLGLVLHKLFRINNTISYLKSELLAADAVIAQTQKEASFINKYYSIPFEKIHIIPNGINEDIINSYDSVVSKDIVLCVGRFDRNKNQLNLIKAMKGTCIPVHFVGGSVPDEQDYYKQCTEEAEGSDNFVFHGWLKQGSEELLKLYKRAKVAVLISYKEIFGNAFVEGAAAGANLVVTKSLPVYEYGFDAGYYVVDPSDIAGIKTAVDKAYRGDIPETLRMQAIEKYSWDNVINRHIKLYEDIISY